MASKDQYLSLLSTGPRKLQGHGYHQSYDFRESLSQIVVFEGLRPPSKDGGLLCTRAVSYGQLPGGPSSS